MQTSESAGRGAAWLRWSGRILGSLAVGLWLLMMVLGAVDGEEPFTVESAFIVAIVLASTVAMVVAWRRERVGGLAVTLCGLAFSVFAFISAGRNQFFAMLVSGIPILVAGLLILGSWSLRRRAASL